MGRSRNSNEDFPKVNDLEGAGFGEERIKAIKNKAVLKKEV